MKAILFLTDNNCAMRAWLMQAKINSKLKETLKRTVGAPWVAMIEKNGQLKFLKNQVDYSTSNAIGTKGVIHGFVLDSGHTYKACVYENDMATIKNYQVKEDGEIVKL